MSDIRSDDAFRRLDDIDHQLRELDLKLGQATLQQQRRDAFLQRRAGWILFWVVLLVLGSCGYSRNDTSDISRQLSSIDSDVSRITPSSGFATNDDLEQLCNLLGRLEAKQGLVPPRVDDSTGNDCYSHAREGYDAVKKQTTK